MNEEEAEVEGDRQVGTQRLKWIIRQLELKVLTEFIDHIDVVSYLNIVHPRDK